MPRSAASLSVIWLKPPLTIANWYPSRFSVRTSVRAPGASSIASYTSSSAEAGSPSSAATRLRSDSAKSSSPRIACSVTSATSSSRPACAASISITSPWIRVESTSITISRLARRYRPTGLYGDVEALPHPFEREHGPQRVGIRTGHGDLHRRHRVARHPADPVDVRAGVGDPPGDRGEPCAVSGLPDHRHLACGPCAAVRCRRHPSSRRSRRRACSASSFSSFFSSLWSRGADSRTPSTSRPRRTTCSASITSSPRRRERRQYGGRQARAVRTGQRDQQGRAIDRMRLELRLCSHDTTNATDNPVHRCPVHIPDMNARSNPPYQNPRRLRPRQAMHSVRAAMGGGPQAATRARRAAAARSSKVRRRASASAPVTAAPSSSRAASAIARQRRAVAADFTARDVVAGREVVAACPVPIRRMSMSASATSGFQRATSSAASDSAASISASPESHDRPHRSRPAADSCAGSAVHCTAGPTYAGTSPRSGPVQYDGLAGLERGLVERRRSGQTDRITRNRQREMRLRGTGGAQQVEGDRQRRGRRDAPGSPAT